MCWLLLCLLNAITFVYSQDMYYSDNVIIGNLKKRDVIPLAQINNPYNYNRRRRFNKDAVLQYRKTKDIRDNFQIDRRFELSESQLRETKLLDNNDDFDELQNHLKWLTIDNEDGIGITF